MYKNQEERIDAYLRNEMTDDERIAFENDVKQDEALARDLKLSQKIVDALAQREQKVQRMQEWNAELKEEEKDGPAEVSYAGKASCPSSDLSVAHPPKKKFRKYILAGLSVAACLAVGLILNDMTSGKDERFGDMATSVRYQSRELYRGGSNAKLTRLIEEKNYTAALQTIDSMQQVYLSVGYVEPMALPGADADSSLTEEQLYEVQVAELAIYNLTWQKIGILVEMKRNSEAIDLLKDFRLLEGEHQAEAEKLWVKLKKK